MTTLAPLLSALLYSHVLSEDVDIAVYSKMHPHTQAKAVSVSASSSVYEGSDMTVISLNSHTQAQNPMIKGDSSSAHSTSNSKSNREGTNGRRGHTSAADRDHSLEDGSAVCVGSHGAHTGSAGAERTKSGRAEEEDGTHYSPPYSPPTLTVQQQLEEIWQTVQLRAVWRPMVSV